MLAITLEGAYGRRYKTAKAIREDFNKDLDFYGRTPEMCGYVNKSQLQEIANAQGLPIFIRLVYNFSSTTIMVKPEKED